MSRSVAPRSIPRQCAGITLVELLIALAIVAILCAFAWPSYSAIIQRAQRHDGRFALLRLQQLQERHYATHLRYADRLGDSAEADTLVSAARSEAGHYQLTLTASADGQAYVATATTNPASSQSRDQNCQRLSVNQIGERRSADASGTWHEADPHRCWR